MTDLTKYEMFIWHFDDVHIAVGIPGGKLSDLDAVISRADVWLRKDLGWGAIEQRACVDAVCAYAHVVVCPCADRSDVMPAAGNPARMLAGHIAAQMRTQRAVHVLATAPLMRDPVRWREQAAAIAAEGAP